MPAISITDDPRERLRWIQRRLEEDVEYGHVRPCDALEYLLDRFDVDDAAASSQSDAERTESVDGSGETTAFEVRNGVGGAIVDTGDTAAAGVDATDTDDTDDTDPAEDDSGPDADDGRDDTSDAHDDGDRDSDTDGDRGSAERRGDPVDGVEAGGDGGDARLNSVLSLLDDNAEVWREASGGDEKYEVDLPDGTTERARTKDDVRALLFEHYR